MSCGSEVLGNGGIQTVYVWGFVSLCRNLSFAQLHFMSYPWTVTNVKTRYCSNFIPPHFQQFTSSGSVLTVLYSMYSRDACEGHHCNDISLDTFWDTKYGFWAFIILVTKSVLRCTRYHSSIRVILLCPERIWNSSRHSLTSHIVTLEFIRTNVQLFSWLYLSTIPKYV